jgi:uroporphyrin-3 C-methyltransferase
MNDSTQTDPSPAVPGATASGDTKRVPAWRRTAPALLIAVLAFGVAAWQWYDSRGEIADLRHEIAKKLTDSDIQSKENRLVAEQVRESVADAQVKLGVLESRLAESQSQQIALEALYQELSRNRDEWAYAEIEQSLFIASQQLALAGNVKGALIALQAADARLQRMNRPQLTTLRKAINRDLERLKTAPLADTVVISARLDSLIAQTDKLPLAMEVRPQPSAPADAPKEAEDNWWTRFWHDTWTELRQLVRVQQVDKPDVALLAPAQSYFLRENLKLRLIGARLALLARDAASYKADLKAARDWLARYYDTRNNGVAYALGLLRNLHDAEVSIEAPDITASLEAMRALRAARERSAKNP